MSKTQKIWFAVFLAMFVVPEVLYPETTVTLYYWIRELFFGISLKISDPIHFDPLNLHMSGTFMGPLLLFKIIGLSLSFLFSLFFYKTSKVIYKVILTSVLGILLLVTLYLFLAYGSFSNISAG